MLEDLYRDDLLGDPHTLEEQEDSRALIWDEERENREDPGSDTGVPAFDPAQNEPQASQPVEPKKKKVVRNPQPRLNPQRLTGPRGIAILENVFKDTKFSGKGHEKKDLNQVMKRLEHWAHRLFPKFQFDDCLEKIETLGHKRPVQTCVKRIRMGLETAEMAMALDKPLDEQNAPDDDDIDAALPADPFDDLLAQQISRSAPRPQPPVAASLSLSPQPIARPPKATLTEEQKERIRKNRLIAEQRLMARFKAAQENRTSDDLLTLVGSSQNASSTPNPVDLGALSQREETLAPATQQPVNAGASQPEGNDSTQMTVDDEVFQNDQLSQGFSQQSVGNECSTLGMETVTQGTIDNDLAVQTQETNDKDVEAQIKETIDKDSEAQTQVTFDHDLETQTQETIDNDLAVQTQETNDKDVEAQIKETIDKDSEAQTPGTIDHDLETQTQGTIDNDLAVQTQGTIDNDLEVQTRGTIDNELEVQTQETNDKDVKAQIQETIDKDSEVQTIDKDLEVQTQETNHKDVKAQIKETIDNYSEAQTHGTNNKCVKAQTQGTNDKTMEA